MAQVPASYIKNKPVDYDGEIFACMQMPVVIAGLAVPPPSLGVFALLEVIESPVVADFAKAQAHDCLRALDIAVRRREAAEDVRQWAKNRDLYDPLDPSKWTAWDIRIAKLAESPDLRIADFALLRSHLMDVTFEGYGMIPQLGSGSSPYLFGAEAIANMVRLCGATNMSYGQLLWELPLCLVGHMAQIAARAAGVKGVSRPKDLADIKRQLKLADSRIRRGKLHPWQKKEPHMYPLDNAQVEAHPEIEVEFNLAMKAYLARQRKKLKGHKRK